MLAMGVWLALVTIAALGTYTFVQVRKLRDEQTAISERNRKDSLQLLRIQNDLASVGVLMRDMLVEHRIDDVRERFVGIEQTVASGQQVAFEPALTLMFAEHLDDAALRREPLIVGHRLGDPLTGGDLEHGIKTVGHGFVGPEDPEVAR